MHAKASIIASQQQQQQLRSLSSGACYDDPRNRCCFDVHVQTGANVVAVVGCLVFCALCVFAMVTGRFGLAAAFALQFVVYALILYGYYSRRPAFYWPFLILNGLLIAVCSVSILFLGAVLVTNPHFWARFVDDVTLHSFQSTINHSPRLITLGVLAVALLLQITNIWFELVVCAAQSFMKRHDAAASLLLGAAGGVPEPV